MTKRTNNALHKKPNVNQTQSYKNWGERMYFRE